MLSPFGALRVNSAKHLTALDDRSFASLRMTSEGVQDESGGSRMTVVGAG